MSSSDKLKHVVLMVPSSHESLELAGNCLCWGRSLVGSHFYTTKED